MNSESADADVIVVGCGPVGVMETGAANGHASNALLDTYDGERRPHATEQVAHSVGSGLLMQAIAHGGDAALTQPRRNDLP